MNKIVLVAEIGINANGDLDIAKRLIDVASFAEFDYIKFQKRIIKETYTEAELNAPRESPWGKTVGDQKLGLEFDNLEYNIISMYCKNRNIKWFASVWGKLAVEFMSNYDIPYIKIPSPLITNMELLEAVKDTKIPVIMSTGMSTKEEVDRCVNYLGGQIEFILACKSTYPTPPREMNMNFIKMLKAEYPKYRIGFSNHNPGLMYCSIAAALGAEMIEIHVTLDRSMYGSDQASSIEPEGIIKLGKYARSIEQGMGTGEWTVFPGEIPIREKLRR